MFSILQPLIEQEWDGDEDAIMNTSQSSNTVAIQTEAPSDEREVTVRMTLSMISNVM